MFLFTEYHIAQNNRFFLDQVDLIEPARWNRMVQDVMLYSDAGLFAGDPVDEVRCKFNNKAIIEENY